MYITSLNRRYNGSTASSKGIIYLDQVLHLLQMMGLTYQSMKQSIFVLELELKYLKKKFIKCIAQ